MDTLTQQPEILYHYTSLDVLFSILNNVKYTDEQQKIPESLTLQATRVDFFNDPTEYEFLGSCIISAMKRYEDDNPDLREKITDFIYSTPWGLYVFDAKPYLVSFSELEDSLSMWRFYGNNGRGIAIGLDRTILQNHLNTRSHFSLCKCDYFTREEVIAQFATEEIYNKVIELQPDEYDGKFWTAFPPDSALINNREARLRIKHKSYADECEWRLVFDGITKQNFKVRSTVIVPYVNIEIPIEALRRIIVGPCTEGIKTVTSIMEFCYSKSINCRNGVSSSDVPYVVR